MLFGDSPKGNKFANADVGENNIDLPLHLSDGLVKTLNEGILISDDCDHILFVNSVFEEMTGIARADILGRDPAELYSLEDHFVLQELRKKTRLENRFHLLEPFRPRDLHCLYVSDLLVASYLIESPRANQSFVWVNLDLHKTHSRVRTVSMSCGR